MDFEDKAFFLYTAIVSFEFHPGVKRRLTPKECAAFVVEYLYYFDKLSKEGLWRGSDQPLEPGPR